MKGLSEFLGRGLLVLALGSCFVACGDDDDGTTEEDAGPDGSTAGTGGSGGSKAGSGGSKAGSGGSAGDGGGKTCEETAATPAATVMAKDACIECVCDMKPSATEACTGDCWKLAFCVAASGCGTSDTTCIRAACVTPLGGMDKYTAAATLAVAVPFQMCAAQCFTPIDDAGTADAGR